MSQEEHLMNLCSPEFHTLTSVRGRGHGVRAMTIARHPGVAAQPRSHITNQRTVEVFRDLGIEERVRPAITL
ncbi:FAD-dependent monooxygenase [Amycolatopsis sp.]|uniref:FAD-dependent monooxygenase n=1 Tax=Amycolatopsis sp. TaxID=37632 RepID=UPI0039C87852